MQMNWLGVVVALVAGTAVAGLWYGKLFAAAWWSLTGITPEQSKASSTRNMVQLVLANALTAVGLALAFESGVYCHRCSLCVARDPRRRRSLVGFLGDNPAPAQRI